jgi:hypothetical protein
MAGWLLFTAHTKFFGFKVAADAELGGCNVEHMLIQRALNIELMPVCWVGEVL